MNKWGFAIVTSALVLLNGFSVAILYGAFDVEAEEIAMSPRVYLASQCKEPDCDFALLDAIAWCESKWQMVPNGVSTAHGYFQIIDGTERSTPQYKMGGSKYDPYDNIDMAIYLYKRDGINPWLSSRPCWHWKYQGNMRKAGDTCLGSSCDE